MNYPSRMRVLVTGATGYVGGRLIPRLLERGHAVTVLVRNPERIVGRPWRAKVQVCIGDLGESPQFQLNSPVDVAFYLVHSMGGREDFHKRDTQAALQFLKALQPATHLIYLGGIAPDGEKLSKHLGSRLEIGRLLSEHAVFTELRAGPIIGSGSASFEMVRTLTERLPLMIAPKWINNRVRPIAIRDMLSYLIHAAEDRITGCFDVGGETLTFLDMMRQWAELRGLRRLIVPVPVLAPTLAARWVGFVTPIPNRIAVPLVQGMLTSIVGDTAKAREVFPSIEPMDYRMAVQLAEDKVKTNFVETRWTGALGNDRFFVLEEREGMIHETRHLISTADPERIFEVFSAAGGKNGWFAWNWAWTVRGILDKMIGGPGLRRGRRHPDELLTGEVVDFWRVEQVEQGRLLRLRAEMKVPGRAWLEWEVIPTAQGSRVRQSAFFYPNGISGRLYWLSLYPIHGWIFSDMLKEIVRRAESNPSAVAVSDVV